MNTDLQNIAQVALDLLSAQGFNHIQITVEEEELNELNIDNNTVTLFRTVSKPRCVLRGIIDGRMAMREVDTGNIEELRQPAQELIEAAKESPVDSSKA